MRPPRSSGSRRGAYGGGAGRGGFHNEGPPKQVVEVSTFLHACEGDAVTKLTQEKIPYFNLSAKQDSDRENDGNQTNKWKNTIENTRKRKRNSTSLY